MLRIAEAFRRFRLRIVFKRLSRRANQAGILGFAPTLTCMVHSATVTGFASADASPIALHNGQDWRTLGPLGKRVFALWIRVTTLDQLQADVMDDPFDGVGGNGLIAHFFRHDAGSLEGARLGGSERDPMDQQGSHLSRVKAHPLSVGGKRPGDKSGIGRSVPPVRRYRRSRPS